jgi:hypothetical protein
METIGGLLNYVLRKNWQKDPDILYWPPYLFAVMALLLKKSGCYIRVLREWPPGTDWHSSVKKLADEWKQASEKFLASPKKPQPGLPQKIEQLIATIGGSKIPIGRIIDDDALTIAILKLLSLADEASAGLGLPLKPGAQPNPFQSRATEYLLDHTITPRIPSTIASVLPKQHTPTGGLSLRSMSHHLALHVGADAYARWHLVPSSNGSQLNIVLAPWPLKIKPKQFRKASPSNYVFAPGFGCFDFAVDENDNTLIKWINDLVSEAKDACGRVDAIVFPETSLTPKQFDTIWSSIRGEGAFLVAGVLTPGTEDEFPKNQVWIKAGIVESTIYKQDKHHRWRLDRRQIEMYGLGGSLDPDVEWWEHIGVHSRAVNFLALDSDLTVCCLVCEDLARQEPVGELVRAVGPNLVVALLADGPQLAQRWPARYATVLADDPGTSVLTVTSLGMAQLAKPPPGQARSRSIALWKDAMGNAEEISLPADASGAVLCLRSRSRPEWAADGRDDTGVAVCPQLVGVHYLKI